MLLLLVVLLLSLLLLLQEDDAFSLGEHSRTKMRLLSNFAVMVTLGNFPRV